MTLTLEMQPGPQTEASRSPADIIFFGGQAGGGKSHWLMLKFAMMALQYPGFQSIIFRRTRPEIIKPGGLWTKSWEIFKPLGFTAREGSYLDWHHSNGSVVKFDHMQLEKNRFDHQGPEYDAVGFDEGTHFTSNQVWYLFGRLRDAPMHRDGTHRLKPFMGVTMNPDPDTFIKDIILWWLDANGQYADPDKAGVIRWAIRRNEKLIWADRPEDLPLYPDDTPIAITFIPAKLDDNKILQERDPTYRSRLRMLLPHEQKALEKGDWNARSQAGDYFQRGWFRPWGKTDVARKVLGQPLASDIIATCRAYDFAATPVEGDLVLGVERPKDFVAKKKDADWTRGLKVGRFKNGDFVLLDLVSCRDTPGAVDKLTERTAKEDGVRTIIHVPQDPGQAGVDQVGKKKKILRKFARVESRVRHKDKEFYAGDVSRAAYAGRIWYLSGPWVTVFFNEIERFPATKDEHGNPIHDDCVDVLADAFDFLDKIKVKYKGGYTSVRDIDKVHEKTDIRTTAGFRRRELL